MIQSEFSTLPVYSENEEVKRQRRETIVDHPHTLAIDETIKSLKFRELIEFAKKVELQNLDSSSIRKIVDNLNDRIAIKQKKYCSQVGGILKVKGALCNGLAKRGFHTTATEAQQVVDHLLLLIQKMEDLQKLPSRTPSKESLLSDVGSLSDEALQSFSSSEPIVYIKGETKTQDLVPTEKHVLGKGKSGRVHQHLTKASLVVKKSIQDLGHEYEIGARLNHPNLVRVYRLYIKHYQDQDSPKPDKYKLVMRKINGSTISKYYGGEEKISDEIVKRLIQQAEDCCLYLFDQGIAWGDVNNGNIFINHKGNLMLADFGHWHSFPNSQAKTLQLLMGAMEIVGWIVKSSNLRVDNQKHPEEEKGVIFPKVFFGEQLNYPQILSFFGANIYDSKPWMQRIKAKMEHMNDQGMKKFLQSYFAQVLLNFNQIHISPKPEEFT